MEEDVYAVAYVYSSPFSQTQEEQTFLFRLCLYFCLFLCCVRPHNWVLVLIHQCSELDSLWGQSGPGITRLTLWLHNDKQLIITSQKY